MEGDNLLSDKQTHIHPPPHTHTHTEFQLQDGGGPAGRYGGVGMGRETNSSLVSLFVQATNGPLVESFEYHFRQTAAARLALHVGYVQSHENVIYNVDAVSSLIHDFLTNTRRQNAFLMDHYKVRFYVVFATRACAVSACMGAAMFGTD